MNSRLKMVRSSLGMTQETFATRNFIAQLEIGAKKASDRTIRDICQKFGVSETWLRTGAGEMTAPKSRQQEMAELTRSLMEDSPESFRSALVTALLRFDPNGPEWAILERIYDSIAREAEQSKPKEEPENK